MTDTEFEIHCPMPDCTEPLLVHFEQDYTLSPDDLAIILEDDEHPMPTPAGAHTSWWSVICCAGHVVLLPGDTGCPCEDDGGGVNCPHDDTLYDWSDESRAFREHDMARLRDVIARLGGAS